MKRSSKLHETTYPEEACSVVLMDFLNYIEIHAVSEKGIPMHAIHTLIHERILNGILSACNFLHHEDTKLDLAFLCPHAQSDNERKCHCNKLSLVMN